MYLVDDVKNLVDYASYVFDLCHPIGEIYIRYPGQSSPQDLYKRGTWENISGQFAGLFFRAEGGNANAFEGGSQEDKIRSIKGGRVINSPSADGTPKGCFVIGRNSGNGTAKFPGSARDYDTKGFDFDANVDTNDYGNPMAGHADGPEIRPVNTTIQIWKRTA